MYNRGQLIDASSPLYPFSNPSAHKSAEMKQTPKQVQTILTAKDVIDTRTFGYTYDDLVLTHNSKQLYNRMTKLYGSPEDAAFR